MTELLAPAGSREALEAAVQSGADAVYLGFGAFNARRNAKNFTPEEFAQAVEYCHLYGVKVYLTMNTLLSDRELPMAAEDARFASRCGVDAILVQDWGVLQMLRQAVPDVPLHASTQMSLMSLSGVEEAAKLGMSRVVVARELSRDDLLRICRESPVEIEAFVHGALCMCYSGQCAMSALIGGRSGNRGTCAQPCRLPYGVNGPAHGYPLSLKDASLADYVLQLQEMGIASLKLEGRMKRPEYVAVITDIYARLLQENRRPSLQEKQALEAAFSRSGFTQGYYLGQKGPQMFGTRPENAAIPQELFAQAKAQYQQAPRKIPVEMALLIRSDLPAQLTLQDTQGHKTSVSGPIPEPARHRELTAEELQQRLSKTGGTAFSCPHPSVSVQPGLSLPAAAVNQLRRQGLEQLAALRCAVAPRRESVFTPAPLTEDHDWTLPPQLTCSVYQTQQLSPQLLQLHPARIYFPLEWMEEPNFTLPTAAGVPLCAVLPRAFRSDDETLFARWMEKAAAQGADCVALHNLGHLPLARKCGLILCGDFGLNLFNSEALKFWAMQGLDSATVSFELRKEQIRDLKKHLPCEAIVYGRLPLMLTENCPIHNNVGCRCQKENFLTDRRGVSFPLLPAFGCRCEIQNAHTLFLAEKGDYTQLGLHYARLRFTTESPEDCVAIFRRYLGQGNAAPQNPTGGLFYRGVD